MRFAWFGGIVGIVVGLVAPWLMATFDCASYSNELLGIVYPATGSAPSAQTIATIAEDAAAKYGLAGHATVRVSDPRVKDPSRPATEPDNWIQDVRIDVRLEKKLWLGTKRAAYGFDVGLGGQGRANAWPE